LASLNSEWRRDAGPSNVRTDEGAFIGLVAGSIDRRDRGTERDQIAQCRAVGVISNDRRHCDASGP
jgi:hypothetical protein